MKNNRKNNKLNFIRIKNKLRLGLVKFYCYEKIGTEIDNYEISSLIEKAKNSLYKNYRLSLPKISVDKGLEGSDFTKDLITYRVVLSLK